MTIRTSPAPQAQMQLSTAGLPVTLALELYDLRQRYRSALNAAGHGDFSPDSALANLAKRLGTLLAREARKPRERRGVSMRDLSLAVDRLFPELREWTLQTALRRKMAGQKPVGRAS